MRSFSRLITPSFFIQSSAKAGDARAIAPAASNLAIKPADPIRSASSVLVIQLFGNASVPDVPFLPPIIGWQPERLRFSRSPNGYHPRDVSLRYRSRSSADPNAEFSCFTVVAVIGEGVGKEAVRTGEHSSTPTVRGNSSGPASITTAAIAAGNADESVGPNRSQSCPSRPGGRSIKSSPNGFYKYWDEG